MNRNTLELALRKTECVFLKGRKRRDDIGFLCEGVEIKSGP